MYFNTSNDYRGRYQSRFCGYHSSIKSMREDFSDMFVAEARMREKRGDRSIVFVLTYNTGHLRSFYGQNVADADDLKVYAKSSAWYKFLRRRGYLFDMVSVPEYGNGGDSHHYAGKRGKGQNPHFHCVAWFRRLDGQPISDAEYQDLIMNVRLAWQGNVEPDPVVYGRSKYLQIDGLGYVKLDGPIISPTAGSSYIGKYIGKDIGTLFMKNLKSRYYVAGMNILRDLLREYVTNLDDLQIYAIIRSWLSRLAYCDSVTFRLYDNRLFSTSLSDFYSEFLLDCPKTVPSLTAWYVGGQDAICDAMTQHFIDFDNEFFRLYLNRYQPKVRKFRGFGYSLLDGCKDGQYQITRNGNTVWRNLPPSLFRHRYYNWQRVPVSVDDTGKVVRWSVVYSLNDDGIALQLSNARKIVDHDVFLVRNVYKDQVSDDLRDLIPQVSFVYRFIFPFDVLADKYDPDYYRGLSLDSSDFRQYLYDLHRKVVSSDCLIEPDFRTFVSGLYISFVLVDPALLCELDDLVQLHSYRKDVSDAEYLDTWNRCYNASY